MPGYFDVNRVDSLFILYRCFLHLSWKIHLCFVVLVHNVEHQSLQVDLCFQLEGSLAIASAVLVRHPYTLLRQILRLYLWLFLCLLLTTLAVHDVGKHPLLTCSVHYFPVEIVVRHGHGNQIVEFDGLLAKVTFVFVDVNDMFDQAQLLRVDRSAFERLVQSMLEVGVDMLSWVSKSYKDVHHFKSDVFNRCLVLRPSLYLFLVCQNMHVKHRCRTTSFNLRPTKLCNSSCSVIHVCLIRSLGNPVALEENSSWDNNNSKD